MEDNQAKKNSLQGSNFNARPLFYEIKIQGHLDEAWSRWFEGMTLTHLGKGEGRGACTLIAGPVIDQPALHGLLSKIRDLNLTLISVRQFIPGATALEDAPISPEAIAGSAGDQKEVSK